MSRPQRWALSPVDHSVHLLGLPGTTPEALMARCGHRLPTGTHQHEQPPPGPPCERCRVIFITDFARDPGRPPVEHPPLPAPGGRPVPTVEVAH